MSLLWSGKRIIKLKTIQRKPSPTNQNVLRNSAQNSGISTDSGKCRPSVLRRFIEGTSLPAFFTKKVKAGMTVEAAIVLPLFLFFFLNLGCAIEMIRLHGNLQLALWQIGSNLSVYAYALDSGELPEGGDQDDSWWKDLAGVMFASSYVKNRLVDALGDNYLVQSPLSDGTESLWLWESEIFGPEDEMDIIVTYSVSPWSSLAGFPSFRMANRYYAHIWNGYQISCETESQEETEMVFVTENGTVYHLDRNCTHLQLSVSQISAAGIDTVRNQYGGRYRACERCTGGEMPDVLFITEDGDCYHYSRECSGLKRTVFSISLGEAVTRYRPCSRCGQ